MKVDSLAELNAKFMRNYRTEGFGIGNVYTYSPCPFCAEPDFMVYEILQVATVVAQEHICKHCKRGSKAIVRGNGMQTTFEFVQTCGEEMPDWFPKMRRLVSPEINNNGRPPALPTSGPGQ